MIPVYRVDEFKGLEADLVLLFFGGIGPISLDEFYVGTSRARLSLSIVIDEGASYNLPPAVKRFWDEHVARHD